MLHTKWMSHVLFIFVTTATTAQLLSPNCVCHLQCHTTFVYCTITIYCNVAATVYGSCNVIAKSINHLMQFADIRRRP